MTISPDRALPTQPSPTEDLNQGYRPGLTDDPDWYRTGVFYQVLLRAFGDSTGSGMGDLRGVARGGLPVDPAVLPLAHA